MEDSVTKRPVKSAEGASRAQLAAAIKASKSAHTAVSKQKQAVQKLFSEMVAAENQIPAAEKAVAKAQNEYIAAVAEAAAAGLPEPVSGKAEAEAALTFKKDRVNVLREARKRLESELPDWQQDVVDSDIAVERLISMVIADYVQVLILEAEEIARRLRPYRFALASFVGDQMDRPREWHKQDSFDKSREPLKQAADQIWKFFRELRECDSGAVNPWQDARERLRENPEASVLRNLVAAFDGLCGATDDAQRPTAPT
jgi:chromosome segregation ATPase